MSSILPVARLTRGELRQLGENVIYAVDHDGEELTAHNRRLTIHDGAVDSLIGTSAVGVPIGHVSPRPAA
jgi:hypothetical protein